MGNLLGENDPPPYIRCNDEGPASVLILCDHASKAIPLRLGNLGISAEQVSTHIAWDIGAQMAAERLAERFDAPALFCGISRLVIDCNRRLGNPMLVPSESDGVVLPGSQGLTQAQIGERIEAIYLPYHYAIVRNLTRFEEKGIRPFVLSVHSCTPVFDGVERPWSIGISHTSDEMISRPIIKALNQLGAFLVGDNEPYDVDLDIDYTICAHALHVGLPHLQVEFRQDLIEKREDAQRWADILYDAIQAVWSPL